MSLEKLFRREREVPIPGVGTITIRNLSERDHAALYDGLNTKDSGDDQTLWWQRVIALSITAINGEPVTIAPEQVPDMDLFVLGRLTPVIKEHCGLGEDDSGNSDTAKST